MIGKSIFEVVHPDDKDAVTREVLRQDREIDRGYNSYSGQLDIIGIYIVYFPIRDYFLTCLIIYMKKLLDSDWLRTVQFFLNTVQKRGN